MIGNVDNTPVDVVPPPGQLTARVLKDHRVNLQWTGAPAPFQGGYWVYFEGNPPVIPSGDSPIDAGNTTLNTVSGLQPGCTYHFHVQTYDLLGRLSVPSNRLIVVVTNGVDGNNDGLPDDWAQCHAITAPIADDDGDGLTNQEKFPLGTDPQDSIPTMIHSATAKR